MLNLDVVDVQRHPFAHIVKENFIEPAAYRELLRTFPECGPNTGPTGYSIFWGDPEYDELIKKNGAWARLFEATQSQALVDYCVRQFGGAIEAEGCALTLDEVKYVNYCESREDKERGQIAHPQHEINELFVRPDIAQAHVGYSRAPHLDHRRRFVTLLVYFCDSDEDGRVGGDLTLLPLSSNPDPSPLVIRPKHNRMVAFACSNPSYHMVEEITAQRAPRNFMQISTSSSVDIWPSLD